MLFGAEELRIIDANSNRAREGIRTAEDYLRFGVGEKLRSGELKQIRHGITQTLIQHVKSEDLVKNRNVARDPSQPGSSEGAEYGDTNQPEKSCKSVSIRGLKRAQEAIRVLEEYTRSKENGMALQFAKMRYQLYEIEQWVSLSSEYARIINENRVYVLLTGALCKNGMLATAKAVLKGGVKLLQIREKNGFDKKQAEEARNLQSYCADYGAVLICNDRLDVALHSGAAGVHLGQNDLAPMDVRKICGARLLIGRSTHSVDQARYAAEGEKADYIAIGSMYETSTKKDLVLAGLRLAEEVSALKLPVPVFGIGGITVAKVPELRAAGVDRVAVSSAIIGDADPEAAARKFVEAMAG